MTIKLTDFIKSINEDAEYLQLNSFKDKNLYESYTLLGELLNPDNSYEYTEEFKGLWHYNDVFNNTYFVRLALQPTSEPYFELKTGYYDEHDVAKYDPAVPENSTIQDWDKRSNTVAKIYRDEVLPIFLKQDACNSLVIKPLEIKRYQLSIRLVKKFTPTSLNIQEFSPTKIIITKINEQ